MANRPKLVTRQDLLALAVTDVDAFTALRYLRHRENVPSLWEAEDKGRTALPGVEGCLLDTFGTLVDEGDPRLLEEVPADRRYWKELFDQTIKTAAFADLHRYTAGSEFKSVLGTVSMAEVIAANVSKEDQEKLQELQQAQAAADSAQQQASQAQNDAQMVQMLAEAAAQQASGQSGSGQSQGQSEGQPQGGQPSGQPSNGQGQLTPDHAKALANQLAKEAQAAQTQAQAAQQAADQAQAQAEALAEALLGKPGSDEAKAKERELARIGMAALKAAQNQVQEVSETIEAWGLEEGELTQQGIPEALAICQKMKRSEAFKKFSQMLGRVRKIAARKAKSKVAGEGRKVSKMEVGRDLRRAACSELVALSHPLLRVRAQLRWARGQLRLKGQETKQALGYGPVIALEDASGSMDGPKQQFAKASVLGLAYYAKLQKRTFGRIMFDTRVKQAQIYPEGRLSAQQLLEIAEGRSGGGTSFEAPLRQAMGWVRKEGLKKADITLITDGECEVSEKFLGELLAFKKEYEVNIVVVLCDVGSSSDASVKQFADAVEHVSQFAADTAESAVFAHL